MIAPVQLLNSVIRPVLKGLELWSEDAEKLVLGTACIESECGLWIKQLQDGPGIGIYQMEAATFNDIWTNFLDYRPELKLKVLKWVFDYEPAAEEMAGNLYYATAMCRVHYYRVKSAIPSYLAGQAAYWKEHYNTEKGAGTTVQYLNSWNRFVAPTIFV